MNEFDHSFKMPALPYISKMICSSDLIVPREDYQRSLNSSRVEKIMADFDERIANEPKVSFRGGKYYVFDGQHTVAARIGAAGGEDIFILCRVYYGMTEQEEAKLFSKQFGSASPLTAGAKLRADIFAGNPEAVAFLNAAESIGVHLDYDHKRGYMRLGCISAARREFNQLGRDRFCEALQIILDAWAGDPESFRAETIQGVCKFIDLYHEEYDRRRLVRNLHRKDPQTIPREGKMVSASLSGCKRYLSCVFRIYNGTSKKNALPMKF